ncbi:MAG: PIN domain nuclease [Bryobacteraceae bacterium]|jgi:predicted nucleic acid-binding protein
MKILVDTSVWIAILRGEVEVDRITYRDYATCGPVVQEVLQGFGENPLAQRYQALFLKVPRLSDPLPSEVFMAAADIYRQGRRRGLTIRSAMDCLIAAIALENGATVWHRDRDFDNIAQFTNLRVRRSLWAN